MRVLSFLLLLAACTETEVGTQLDQLDANGDGDISLEERHQLARDAMNDRSRGVQDRYEDAIEWCDGQYAVIHDCAGEIANMAEAELASALQRHNKTAEIVNQSQAEELVGDCTPVAMLQNNAAFNQRCDLAPFSERLEESQASWQEFVELQCNLEASNSFGGSLAHANSDMCLTRLIGARIEGLQSMMDYYEDQYLPLEETSQ